MERSDVEMEGVGAEGSGASSQKRGNVEAGGEEDFGLPGGAPMDGTSRNSRWVPDRLGQQISASSHATCFRARASDRALPSLSGLHAYALADSRAKLSLPGGTQTPLKK